MEYQLVLRFRSGALPDIAVFEREVTEVLAGKARLDGHDIGAGGVDVFLLTADPSSAFRRMKPVLQQRELLLRVTAAHRLVGGHQFTVLWPLRSRRKFTLAG
jgi:hypothetical protein